MTSVETSLSSHFAVGDLMHVSITYESTTLDWWAADPSSGLYLAITSLDVSVGSYTASGSDGSFIIHDNDSGRDYVSGQVLSAAASMGSPFTGTLTGPDVAGLPLWMFDVGLSDSTQTALSSDALPTSFDPSRFDYRQLSLAWRHETDHGTYNDRIVATDFTSTSSFHPVPVPGALLLAGLGLGMASRLCHRTRRSA
ncbi:MAG: hypothetical protein A2Y77_10180 [Planctomycetes bacterium RBG_13_62_9]|nr:MAG: hypothetical protein A2Y77_10180 [Planctomycetes bacterium RBG_13_62_9]